MAALTPDKRPGDFAQAMMDLGSSLCSPKKPACGLCPFSGACDAQQAGDMEIYPIKAPKKVKPTRRGAAFLIIRSDGAVWLQKRPPKGLLASMTQVPTTNWFNKQEGEGFEPRTALSQAPTDALSFRKKVGQVTHTFTHFHLELDIYAETDMEHPIKDGWWSLPEDITGEALPTVFRKVLDI